MAGMRRTYTEKERLDLIGLVKADRATVREAAEQVGVTVSTAYKWMRDASLVVGPPRARARSTPTFVRVLSSREADVAISVRVGAAEIQVGRGFDADLLRAVVQALGGAGT